ncbi:Hypothetical protein R9X50_00348600 [Acrodontium crateriforme]|uniref:Uncharacterized protein n=1 Tax=Acrodontium crateriforme TaxID=150365 RepID=A0AAQ3M694_9PEZI|nr:Hypothetical protein R9X50_00348600 [Acrodontium crateriforme]
MPGPSKEELRKVATQAEADLNSYQGKSGASKQSSNNDSGVDTRIERNFEGAEVRHGDDLNTSASYNKRIPPKKGGELDDRGRQTKGEMFEGQGGPEDKLA